MTIAPFPTDYQLEQIGKLVLVDRTRPWILEKYFDASHFTIIDQPLDRQMLFTTLCAQLQREGFVDADFLDSVVEREAIVSTMLGEGSRCRTRWACWRKRRWSIRCWRPVVFSGERRRLTLFSCWPLAKVNMRRRWRYTIFSSRSYASGQHPD